MSEGSLRQGPGASFNSTFQPASVLDHPGVIKPNGGVSRTIAFVRTLTLSSVGLAMFVFTLQATMPEGRRPSDVFGGFQGATESAEIKAKQQASAEYARHMADAQAAPPANWIIEQNLAQTQLQERAKSLETQETVANLADLACFGSMFVKPLMGNTRDARELEQGLQGGCAAGEAIRNNINTSLAASARHGSGIVPRSTPETGAGSEPAAPASSLRR